MTADESMIPDMLEVCLENLHGSSYDFVESLQEYYDKNGTLTPNQFEALEKFYERLPEKVK